MRLRLTRVGSRKNPIWRVVATDGRSPRDGRVLEIVGRYNPQPDPSEIVLDRERVDHWLARGAQPSDTVHKLIVASERGAPPASAAAATKASAPATPASEETAGAAVATESPDAEAGPEAPEASGSGDPEASSGAGDDAVPEENAPGDAEPTPADEDGSPGETEE